MLYYMYILCYFILDSLVNCIFNLYVECWCCEQTKYKLPVIKQVLMVKNMILVGLMISFIYWVSSLHVRCAEIIKVSAGLLLRKCPESLCTTSHW